MAVPPYLRKEHKKLTPQNLVPATGGKGGGWYSIVSGLQMKDEDGGGTGAEIFIYDEIGGWGVMAADFVRDLQALDADTVNVRISSPGGSVFEALAIYASLKNLEAKVNCVIDGLCASAATVVAMGGDTVTTAPGSMWMVHDAMNSVFGNQADMEQMADLLGKTSQNIADIYAARAGGTADEWRATMRAETWYTADEAVSAGLADGLTESAKPTAKAPAITNKHEAPAFVFDAELFRTAVKEAVS